MKAELHPAFEQFYKNYYPKLAAYASLFIKDDEVHDLVQEIFLDLLEKNNKELEHINLNGYLYKAVRNKCIDAIRHNIVKEQYSSVMGKKLLEMESGYFYISHNEIEESLTSKELQKQIAAAVETLPPKGKEVFKLYFENQKTAKEIAVIMNLSCSTVENHIYTCIKSLRLKLSKSLLCMLLCVLCNPVGVS